MTDWFDLPEGAVDIGIGHFQNGLGLEHNKTAYANSVGHTGGIDGFLSIAQYFAVEDFAFVLLVIRASYDDSSRLKIFNATLNIMFSTR